jgi:hypothetical protein
LWRLRVPVALYAHWWEAVKCPADNSFDGGKYEQDLALHAFRNLRDSGKRVALNPANSPSVALS